jgi:hypothetical protein
MEMLLKSRALWQFTRAMVPDPKDYYNKFIINGKKDEAIGVINTYISREIRFHTRGSTVQIKSGRSKDSIRQDRQK